MPADRMTEVLAAIGGHATRGPYRWLWDHWPELAAAKADRPNWKGMAAAMTAMGVRSRSGKRVTGEAVRQAFLKVEADVAEKGWRPLSEMVAPASDAPREPVTPPLVVPEPQPATPVDALSASPDNPPAPSAAKPALWSGWRNRRTG